mmetsp:Transcript_8558/g.25343  ORF Transcript_8558/g.25343 Transcript_8558/m.25343 type:complete len:545 (+) Transcript_8558:1005-2639(+)
MGNVVAAVASVSVRDLGPVDERVADLAGDPKALRVDCQDRQRVGSLYLEGQIDAVPGGRLVDLSQRGAGDGFRRQVLKQGLLLLGAVVVVVVDVATVQIGSKRPVPVLQRFPNNFHGQLIVKGSRLSLETLEGQTGVLADHVRSLAQGLSQLDGEGSQRGDGRAQLGRSGRFLLRDSGFREFVFVAELEELLLPLPKGLPVGLRGIQRANHGAKALGDQLLALPARLEEKGPEDVVLHVGLPQRLVVSPLVQQVRGPGGGGGRSYWQLLLLRRVPRPPIGSSLSLEEHSNHLFRVAVRLDLAAAVVGSDADKGCGRGSVLVFVVDSLGCSDARAPRSGHHHGMHPVIHTAQHRHQHRHQHQHRQRQRQQNHRGPAREPLVGRRLERCVVGTPISSRSPLLPHPIQFSGRGTLVLQRDDTRFQRLAPPPVGPSGERGPDHRPAPQLHRGNQRRTGIHGGSHLRRARSHGAAPVRPLLPDHQAGHRDGLRDGADFSGNALPRIPGGTRGQRAVGSQGHQHRQHVHPLPPKRRGHRSASAMGQDLPK